MRQWMGKLGWLVALLVGLFCVLMGVVGYFSGIGNSDTFEITLAVGFFVFGTGIAGTAIWQLAVGDRRKRRVYGPHPAPSPRPQDAPAPVTPARPIPHAPYTPPPAPLAAETVAQTPDWVRQTRSAQHWLPSGIPYASAPTGILGAPADLDRDSAATIPVRIREAVRETIAIEGPIERAVLVARVAQRFGVRAPSDKQQIRVLGEVPENLMRATSLGVFAWPSDLDPGTWRGFRFTPPTVARPIETICAEEIVNAITQVAQRDRHSFDDIVWATLTQFGHDRTGAAEDRIEACLTQAVRRGRLARDPDGRYRALG